VVDDEPVELDEKTLKRRRGRERKGRPVGRYMMCVSRGADATHISVLEGRQLIEHYVSRPSDDVAQIHGNIYLGRVQNVLPGMEAAFIDIGTPKNAVLYRGDVQYDPEDIVERAQQPRIEQLLKARQMILCQVTRSPTRVRASPRRCRFPVASWCWSRTPRPTASRSDCPRTSASASARSSTRCGPRSTA
jgi:ribonuclease E